MSVIFERRMLRQFYFGVSYQIEKAAQFERPFLTGNIVSALSQG
jgi:hypothetical protein